jgi:DNA-binding transcriptional LysR family regulator
VIASRRAYDKLVSLCEECGFRPQVVQVAPQWLTILRLVGAGIGVSVAPACVQRIATPDVTCRSVRGTKTRSDIELAYRKGQDRAIVKTFCDLARSLLSDKAK